MNEEQSNWPCQRCKHKRKDHSIDRRFDYYPDHCKAGSYGPSFYICKCSKYIPLSNLEYLEELYEKNGM